MSRRIAVVTVARSDYGLYHPVLRALQAAPDVELQVVAGAAHLSPEHGGTLAAIVADGFSVAETVDMLLSADTGDAVATSMGLGVMRFADAYRRLRPDLVLLLGDRSEMFAAAAAAVPMSIPLAHLHGGEVTEGAIDDALRHAITKLSHLHFASTEQHARRIRQMGEEGWRVRVTGSPAIDNLLAEPPLPREDLWSELGLDPGDVILVTFHPVTLEPERAPEQVERLLTALAEVKEQIVITAPNADRSHRGIREALERFVAGTPRARLIASLGRRRYPSMLRHARAMVGNSSSGLIEAPTFGLPVVNIGTRQQGRTRAANVIDVGDSADEIRAGLARALSPDFRAGLGELVNPYGDGYAAGRVADALRGVELNERLLRKRFVDLPSSTAT